MKSFLLYFFIFFLFSDYLYAEKTDVVYVGFSLSSEFSDLNTVVKYTNKIIEKAKNDGTQNIIDKGLIEVTKKLDLNYINLSYDLITEETSKIAMSVFLDQEILEEFALPNQDCKKINLKDCYIYRINNQYQIIFFDFKQMTFIKAVPFEGIYISSPSSKLDEEGKIKLFEESYKNGNWLFPPTADQEKKNKLTDRIYSLVLPKTEIKTFYENYLGVNPSENGFKINIDKISALTPSYILENIDLLKRQVANYFLAEITLKHNIPIVPYYEGVGVGGTLKAKYANRNEVFNLKIPEPTYYIDFLIRGFLKKEFKKDANVENLTWWIYGSGISLRIYEPLLNKEFLNIAMTKADYKKIPDILKLNSENEFVNIYQLTLKPLSEEFANIIGSDLKSKKNKEWLKKVTKDKTKPIDINTLNELFTRLSAN